CAAEAGPHGAPLRVIDSGRAAPVSWRPGPPEGCPPQRRSGNGGGPSRGRRDMAHDQLASVAGEDFAMPLTIGATGHRDLRPEDVPRLAEAVASVLSAL